MAQNITYSCDRCGHIQRSTQSHGAASDCPRVMYTVGLTLSLASATSHSYSTGSSGIPARDMVEQQMWCSDCCNEVLGRGAIITLDKVLEAERKAQMAERVYCFEDHLRELVRDVVREERESG